MQIVRPRDASGAAQLTVANQKPSVIVLVPHRHLVREMNLAVLSGRFEHRENNFKRGHAPSAVVVDRLTQHDRVVKLEKLGSTAYYARSVV